MINKMERKGWAGEWIGGREDCLTRSSIKPNIDSTSCMMIASSLPDLCVAR